MSQAGYTQAGVQPPAINTPNDATFFRAVFDNIYAAYNATDTLANSAVADGNSNGGKLAKFAADGSMSFAATAYFAAISASSAIVAQSNISTNGNLVAAGMLIAGTGSTKVTTPAGLLDATKLTGTAPSSIIAANSITDDMFAGLAYSISPAGALRVRVEAQNIWNGTSFIQFTQADSVAIDTSGIGSSTGTARIDLLYIDQSGKLQWQPGTPALSGAAPLPQPPLLAFVPVVYVKVYGGAAVILPTDQGHDAYFYANARLKTNPLGASAISVHSLPINRIQDLAAYQTPNAGLTINIAPGGFFNSLRTWVDYPGGTFVYTTAGLNNAQTRWDLLYLDDLGRPLTASLGPAAAKISPTTGQYPIAYINLPPNTTQILDQVNFTGAAGQGYILYAQGLLSAAMGSVSGTTATGITATTNGNAVTALAGFPAGSGYTNANPPVFVFSGGGGTGASATPTLSGGAIIGYSQLVGGTGYTTAPTVTVSSAGNVVPITLGGTGKTDGPSALGALGGAAAGNNSDIQTLNTLASVTNPVTFTKNTSFSSNIAVSGTIGQGVAANPAIGIVASQPAGGPNHFAILATGAVKVDPNAGAGDAAPGSTVTAALAATKAFATTGNDNVLTVTAIHTATNSPGSTQKNAIGVYVRQDENSTLGTTGITRDVVAADFQAWINDGLTQGRAFALHTQVNVGILAAAEGNICGYEGQIVNHGSDVASAAYGGSLVQKVAIALNANKGPGLNPATAWISLGGDGGNSLHYAHHGLYAQSGSIGSAATDSFLMLENKFVVRPDGTAVFGDTVAGAGATVDVRGDIRSTGWARVRSNARGSATALANGGAINPADGQVQRFFLNTTVTGIRFLPLPAGNYDGTVAAGSTVTMTLINEHSGNSIQWLTGASPFDPATNAVIAPVNLTPQSAQSYVWDPAAGAWYKLV